MRIAYSNQVALRRDLKLMPNLYDDHLSRWPQYAVAWLDWRCREDDAKVGERIRAPSLRVAVAWTIHRHGLANLPSFPAYILRRDGGGYLHVRVTDVRTTGSYDALAVARWGSLDAAVRLGGGIGAGDGQKRPIAPLRPGAPVGLLGSRSRVGAPPPFGYTGKAY